MKVLLCKIFGHKFYYTWFKPDGGWERGVSGFITHTGMDMRKETNYCTRCGMTLSKINGGKQ